MTDTSITRKLYRVYLLFAYALTIVGAVANSLILRKYFDTDAGNWTKDAPKFIGLINVLIIAVGIVIFLTVFLMIDKNAYPRTAKPPINTFTKCISCICGVFFILTLVFQFVFPQDPLTFASLAETTPAAIMVFHIFTVATSLFAGFYFIQDIFTKKKSVLLGLLLMLFLTSYALRMYFDMNMMLNNPRRALSIVSACAALLFILFELRLYTGKASHRMYIVSAMSAMLICSMSGIANLLLETVLFNGGIQTTYYLAEFAIGIYAAVKLGTLASEKAFLPCPDDDFAADYEAEASEKITDTDSGTDNNAENTGTAQTDSSETDDSEDKNGSQPNDTNRQEKEDNTDGDDEKSENADNTDKKDEPDDDTNDGNFPVSRAELAVMYDYLYKTVALRMKDTDTGEELNAKIRNATLGILKTVFTDDEGRDSRIEKLRVAAGLTANPVDTDNTQDSEAPADTENPTDTDDSTDSENPTDTDDSTGTENPTDTDTGTDTDTIGE